MTGRAPAHPFGPGVLLQAAFLFLYFARTGPMQIYLVPLAILTGAVVLRRQVSTERAPNLSRFARATATAGVLVLLTLGWLFIDEPDPSATQAVAGDLTTMTFNIQEGFSNENVWDLEATARAIEAHDPDIVVLQEITRGWLVMMESPWAFEGEVEMMANGLVVAAVGFHPNWRVVLDGAETGKEWVLPGLIGLRVPAGRHIISFEYRGSALKKYLLLLAIAVIGTARLAGSTPPKASSSA